MSWSNGSKIRRVVVFCSILALIATLALAQSWNYREVSNIGYWTWGTTDRFKYDYAALQWWDTTTFGGWQKLGAVGQSAANHTGVLDPNFVGNGSWHTVGTGLSYIYTSIGDYSNWLVNGNMRFAYTYGSGLWADYYWGTNTWSLLGSAGLSSSFLGDGGWHTVGTGLSYRYASSGDYGNWLVNGAMRYAYTYGTGLWADYSSGANAWSLLGAAGLSSAFLGDGGWHTVGTGLSYRYSSSGDYSNWLVNGSIRFAYTYGAGLWADYYWGTNTWSILGSSGISSAFLGDGGWHTVGTGLSYRYSSSGDYSNWLINGNMRFAYTYGDGLWADYYAGSNAWYVMGPGGMSSAFIGDGNYHTFTGNGLYKYSRTDDYGYWNYQSYDIYRIAYLSSTFYYRKGSSWSNMETSYTTEIGTPDSVSNTNLRLVGTWGNGRFVESRLAFWGGSDYDIFYDYVYWSSGIRYNLANWAVFNPGADQTWTASNGLKIGFIINDGTIQLEDAKEDVIQFYNSDIHGYSFSDIVTLTGRLVDYYGMKCSTVAITQHGWADWLGIGTTAMAHDSQSAATLTSLFDEQTDPVQNYESLFRQWASLLEPGGQVHFNHCVIAATGDPYNSDSNGPALLSTIAGYMSGLNIFASNDSTQIGPPVTYDWYMEWASNGNPSSYNCIYNYDTSWDKPYDPEWWR